MPTPAQLRAAELLADLGTSRLGISDDEVFGAGVASSPVLGPGGRPLLNVVAHMVRDELTLTDLHSVGRRLAEATQRISEVTFPKVQAG